MAAQENKKVVQDAYAAFGRGDIPALLDMLTDDVDWMGVIGAGPNVPTRGQRRGRQEVAQFFEQVSAAMDWKRFEPRQFVADGDIVAVTGTYDAVVRPTGRRFASDWVMVFTMRDGKIARFQEFTDSLGLTNAF